MNSTKEINQTLLPVFNNKVKRVCEPLPDKIRTWMEAFFGFNFSDVRIHVGREATAIGARAFTCGTHIYFAPGAYNLNTADGVQLLAHELTHVVQQHQGRVIGTIDTGIEIVNDSLLEAEADACGLMAARLFLSGNDYQLPVYTQLRAAIKRVGVSYCISSRVIQCKLGAGVREHIKKLLELCKGDPNVKWIKEQLDFLEKLEEEYDLEKVFEFVAKRIQFSNKNSKRLSGALILEKITEKSFVKLRQTQLKEKNSQLWLSQTYGFQVARDTKSKFLNLNGAFIGDYYRISKIQFDAQNKDALKKAIEAKTKNKEFEFSEHEYPFLALACASEVKWNFFNEQFQNGYKAKIDKLDDGLFLYQCEQYPGEFKHMGLTASIYSMVEFLEDTKEEKMVNGADCLIHVLALAKELQKNERQHLIVEVAYKLIVELLSSEEKKFFRKGNEYKCRPVVKSALESLFALLQSIGDNFTNNATIVQLIFHELTMMISGIKPYKIGDADEAIKNIYTARIPSLKDKDKNYIQGVRLESSGMGAITTAIMAIGTDLDNLTICKINSFYYELNEIEAPTYGRITEQLTDETRVFLLTLNSSDLSSNSEDFSLEKVTNQIKKLELGEFITLIIDATIEIATKNNGEKWIDKRLEKVVDELIDYIKNGSLNIIIAKSYQKYGALVPSNIMSGVVFSINNGEKEGFRNCNDLIKIVDVKDKNKRLPGLIKVPDQQMMVHILTHAGDYELKIINQAAENAKFISCCLELHQYVEGMPFLFVEYDIGWEDFLDGINIYDRQGFGYPTSYRSKISIKNKNFIRIAVGLESKERLVELFSANPYTLDTSRKKNDKYKEIENIYPDNVRASKMLYGLKDKRTKYEKEAYIKELNEEMKEFDYLLKARFITPEMKADLGIEWMKIAFDLIPKGRLEKMKDKIASDVNKKILEGNKGKVDLSEIIICLDEKKYKVGENYKVNLTIGDKTIEVDFGKDGEDFFTELKHHLGYKFGKFLEFFEQFKESIQNNIPSYRIVLFFKDILSDYLFSTLPADLREGVAQSFLSGIDLNTKVFVCKELVRNGNFAKAKVVLELISDSCYCFQLSDEAIQLISSGLPKEHESNGFKALFKEFDKKKLYYLFEELMTEMTSFYQGKRKDLDNDGKYQYLFDAEKNHKFKKTFKNKTRRLITAYFIPLVFPVTCTFKSEIEKIKKLTVKGYSDVDELKSALEGVEVKEDKINEIIEACKRRVIVDRGLLVDSITSSIYTTSMDEYYDIVISLRDKIINKQKSDIKLIDIDYLKLKRVENENSKTFSQLEKKNN